MIYALQKASILKRISAFLLDLILICILATGFVALIALIVDYDGQLADIRNTEREVFYKYGMDKYFSVEEGKNPTILYAKPEYDKLPDEGKTAYNQAHEDYGAQRGRTVRADYEYLYGLVFLMVSLSLFFAYLILEFILPIILKHGRTVGKRIFGVGVMLISGVQISKVALFVRSMLGKYAVETMVPVFLVFMFFIAPNTITFIVFVALLILQLVLIIATKNNSLIHDILSSTVTVDMSTQMIFDTTEQLLAYKEEISKQQAEQAKY